MATFGRRPIFTRFHEINANNIAEVMGETLPNYYLQRSECRHLFDVYRGKQKILEREKNGARTDILNKLVVNHANEIVSFKTSYLLSEPIKYVTRAGDNVDVASEDVNRLNEFMYMEGAETKDKELSDWFNICGIGYKMALPREGYQKNSDDAPFEIYTLEPEHTFVIRDGGLGHKVLAGVYMTHERVENGNLLQIANVYTDSEYFEFDTRSRRVMNYKRHALGCVPIFEWVNNTARMGSFEVVETLLDAINTLESNRLDATEQAVQSFLMFKNCEIDSDGLNKLRSLGAVTVKAPQGIDADIKNIGTDLDQEDQQVLMTNLYKVVLSIAGMPAMAENKSDSSNNGAVFMRTGWYAADARAKDSEKLWRESEMKFLKLILKICRDMNVFDLKARDLEPKFTRRNYEDILSKSQTLVNMLTSGIHPLYAIEQCGLFYDPNEVYKASEPYLEKYKMMAEGALDENEDPDSGHNPMGDDKSLSKLQTQIKNDNHRNYWHNH